MPVDAEMDAREIKVGVLYFAVLFVRIARRHKQGLVNFEAPGAALDGSISGEAGEPAAWGQGLAGYTGASRDENYRSIDN